MTAIAVVICSVGRPDCLRELAPVLAAQERVPDRVVFALTKPEDIGFDPAPLFPPGAEVTVLYSEKGLPRQRNAGLECIGERADIVVFFDDDFIPAPNALAGIERAFAQWPEISGMTGHLVADGIEGEGFTIDQAKALLLRYADGAEPGQRPIQILRDGLIGLYGCNMAYRVSAIGAIRFDEALPLYAWQEDIDFAARVPGGLVETDAFAGVHLGAKSGRETAGHRLGYSQIANPWYLWRKGTMPGRFGFRLALRNMLANHARMLRPEPWIDRKARARGNWLALFDILRGRARPDRILDL